MRRTAPPRKKLARVRFIYIYFLRVSPDNKHIAFAVGNAMFAQGCKTLDTTQ